MDNLKFDSPNLTIPFNSFSYEHQGIVERIVSTATGRVLLSSLQEAQSIFIPKAVELEHYYSLLKDVLKLTVERERTILNVLLSPDSEKFELSFILVKDNDELCSRNLDIQYPELFHIHYKKHRKSILNDSESDIRSKIEPLLRTDFNVQRRLVEQDNKKSVFYVDLDFSKI